MKKPGRERSSAPEAHTSPTSPLGSNDWITGNLRQAAELLAQQGANPFRVSAYLHAADTITGLRESVADLLEREGVEGLVDLPTIGRGIARAIQEMVLTGRWGQLERLRGEVDAVGLFQSVPGIGPELAERIHETLDIDTLEALEIAASDGSLARVEGIGRRRLASIRASLTSMLGRPRRALPRDGPPVGMLLDVDREYRERSIEGALPRIAPRRFNPTGEAWLPILHSVRDDWHFTALYSNTARAHELGKTNDWVVLYFYDDHHREGQSTVVSEKRGSLGGERVVRGREAECRVHYDVDAVGRA